MENNQYNIFLYKCAIRLLEIFLELELWCQQEGQRPLNIHSPPLPWLLLRLSCAYGCTELRDFPASLAAKAVWQLLRNFFETTGACLCPLFFIPSCNSPAALDYEIQGHTLWTVSGELERTRFLSTSYNQAVLPVLDWTLFTWERNTLLPRQLFSVLCSQT